MGNYYIYEYKPFVQYNSPDAEYIPYSNTIYDDPHEADVICNLLNQDPDVFNAMVFYRKISDWEPT